MWKFNRNKNKETSPTIEEAMKMTGLSEGELFRRFLEYLIQQGKNPFKDLPPRYRREVEEEYPDLLELCRKKFGTDY